jgi:small subunit ribosomal protein S1
VCRVAQFGYFVELLPGVEGLCHRSEVVFETAKRRGAPNMEEETSLSVGQEFDFKIIKLNEEQKRIGLSLRAKADEDERMRLADYQKQAAAATTKVGEVIRRHEVENGK